MNNYGTEDYVEKPEHDFKHTDEHTDERTDERTDEHTDERIEADEGDAEYAGNAAVTEPVESEEPAEHEDEERYDREEPAEHDAAFAEPGEREAQVAEPDEHEATFADPAEHEALTTESAEPEPWIAEPDEHESPIAEPDEPESAASEPLLAPTSAEAFLDRWSDVQTTFIEDPHRSVTEADALLTEVLSAYRDAVEQRREQISSAWSGDATDTEKMRLALLDYRNVITTMLPAHSDGGKTGAVA